MIELSANDTRITWSKHRNTFSCVACDIGWKGGLVELTNPKTGGRRVFAYNDHRSTAGWETASWILTSPEGIKLEIVSS
jgi:hypothetical protein